MSKEKNTELCSEAIEKPVENTVKKSEERKPLVYCGPTVKGVAKQFTVFSNGLPQTLRDFLTKHSCAAALTVPVERFGEVRAKIETIGTAENILYRKLKAEIKEEK